MSEHNEDGYIGLASLIVDDTEITIDVQLRGHFQPIDGFYHWYGRIAANDELGALTDGRKTRAVISTHAGSAHAEISDPDVWGRYRITGTSTPPFAVPTSLEELEI